MPTTLITQTVGIGLGVMGQALAEHCPEVTHIVAVKRGVYDGVELKFTDRCSRIEWSGGELFVPALNTKAIYIESSYGFAKKLHAAGYRTIYVPMWEQQSVREELLFASLVVCVTQKTHASMGRYNATSKYLPWPVDTGDIVPKRVARVRTVLHNAGSLGGNLRKGTLEAIGIFQRSGVAKRGVRLVIHSWVAPTEEIKAALAVAPDGIEWTGKFLPRAEDIYDEYDPDLLLMPSKIEGHALVILEAMARGVPALMTASAPIDEYETCDLYRIPVSHHVASPLRAPYAIVDVAEGAQRLRRLCAVDLTEKSIEVADFVEEQMSWRALGDEWRELLA